MLQSNEEIGGVIRKNVLLDYMTQIRSKVFIMKRKTIKQMMERKDYQMILASSFKDNGNMRNILVS